MNIALKEMHEANYWLRIIAAIKEVDAELENLLKESFELRNILGAISSKSTKRYI